MTILLVAGEASGDLHGAAVAREIRRRAPACRLVGVGGDEMERAGVELLLHAEEIAVLGFVEVARRWRALRRAAGRLEAFLREERPLLFVPIDYPGMNLRLAAAAKRRGIRVVYFVSPQIWAWGGWRLNTIRRVVDRMLVILPFEEAFYRSAGIPVTFVGHPLLDLAHARVERSVYRARLGVPPGARLVALLPGSREQEVSRLFPVMLGAAEELAAGDSDIRFVAAAASSARAGELRRMAAVGGRRPGARGAGSALGSRLTIVEGETYDAVAAADLALVASGTATLECACLGTPMVVLYRVSGLSWWLARRLVRIPRIALTNVVAGRALVPELLQGSARPDRVAAEARAILGDGARRAEIAEGLAAVRAALGEPGAAGRAAEAVLAEAAVAEAAKAEAAKAEAARAEAARAEARTCS